jgi:microcompartment protein CcmL/EutN
VKAQQTNIITYPQVGAGRAFLIILGLVNPINKAMINPINIFKNPN